MLILSLLQTVSSSGLSTAAGESHLCEQGSNRGRENWYSASTTNPSHQAMHASEPFSKVHT